MGALVGLAFAIGVILVALALYGERAQKKQRQGRMHTLVSGAGITGVTAASVYSAMMITALVVGSLVLILTAVPIVALMAAGAASAIPVMIIKKRAKSRKKALRTSWPDAVDTLGSAVRAGMSLPESLVDLSKRGPWELRGSFGVFAATYRATGSFSQGLDALQSCVADPVADRVVMALRIAHEVGGNDLGKVLRTLSALLREDAVTRGDIEARQSWTISAARMSIAAPWLTLAFLCTRPEAVAAFSTLAGGVVLLTSALLSLVAYRIMLRIGRLPTESRVIVSKRFDQPQSLEVAA